MAAFGQTLPTLDGLSRLRVLLSDAGIALRCATGTPEIEPVVRAGGLEFEAVDAPAPAAHELDRRRALRPQREAKLSDAARSLVADFAGARADIAGRRQRGEASVPRLDLPQPPAENAPALHLVAAAPTTLYHPGTLRGGQALHHDGNIVVVGDVNPGAELIATGDVDRFRAPGRRRARGRAGRLRRPRLRARTRRDPVAYRDVHRDGRGGARRRSPRRFGAGRGGASARRPNRGRRRSINSASWSEEFQYRERTADRDNFRQGRRREDDDDRKLGCRPGQARPSA